MVPEGQGGGQRSDQSGHGTSSLMAGEGVRLLKCEHELFFSLSFMLNQEQVRQGGRF